MAMKSPVTLPLKDRLSLRLFLIFGAAFALVIVVVVVVVVLGSALVSEPQPDNTSASAAATAAAPEIAVGSINSCRCGVRLLA